MTFGLPSREATFRRPLLVAPAPFTEWTSLAAEAASTIRQMRALSAALVRMIAVSVMRALLAQPTRPLGMSHPMSSLVSSARDGRRLSLDRGRGASSASGEEQMDGEEQRRS